MNYEIYTDLNIADDLRVFEFMSVGRNGTIPKRVAFMPTDLPGVYNLAFGDIKQDGQLDDQSITDNGDRNKISATIAKVIDIYTERYPDRWIYFSGSTNDRTRLYRMAVSLNLDELLTRFDIYAEIEGLREFVPFQKNMPVSAFLVKRKID